PTPRRRATRTPSPHRVSGRRPATLRTPAKPDPASSTRAAATSPTATGQRTSSVNRTPAASPRASASANRSYFDSGRTPPDTRSEVRTIAASGATAATATSAAAFAAPYGNTGDGSSASVYGSGRPL